MVRKKEYFDESVFLRLSEQSYWDIANFVIDDVFEIKPCDSFYFTQHERRFVQLTLLLTNVMGGVLWNGAIKSVCNITFNDIKDIVENKTPENNQGFWMTINKNENHFDLFLPNIIKLSLYSVVSFCLLKNPQKNNSFRWPGNDCLIIPTRNEKNSTVGHNHEASLTTKVQKYLNFIANHLKQPKITLSDYLTAGRCLSLRIYDLDVAYTNLGIFERRACLRREYQNPKLLSILRNIWE